MFDIGLDSTGDLPTITQHISGIELIAQKIKIRLLTFKGEWKLNEALGLDYPGWFQTKPAPVALASGLIRQEIEATTGVEQITSWDVQFDAPSRLMTITAAVLTTAGVLTVEVSPLGPGTGNAQTLPIYIGPSMSIAG